jgi:hypothetical protein
LNPTLLAVLCTKVSEDSSIDDLTKEKARKLKMEWASLQTSVLPSEKKKHDEKVEENRQKMVELLRELLK